MRRVHAIWLSAIAGGILVFTTIVLIDWAPLAGDSITRMASRALGRSVTIAGPIRMRPTFSGLESRAIGIVIGSPDWARSDEFASIDTAEITFSWLPLLVGVFEPNRIRIRGVLFELESRPSGTGYRATWQVGSLDPARNPNESGVLRFRGLPRIVMEDAALAVTDAYGQLHDIAVRRFVLRRKGRGAVASALLGEAGAPVKLGWSVSSLEELGTNSSEMALTVESESGMVTASGELGFNANAGFDLRSHWDLSALGRFADDFGLSGLPRDMPLTATIRMAGRADAFAVQIDKLASEDSRLHGVLQGRLVRQGGAGSAYNLLELTGELASQHLDPTPIISAVMAAPDERGEGKRARSSLVDFLFGPGLVMKLDVEVSALELAVHDAVLKNASGRLISDARLFRLAGVTGRLGKGSLAFDLVTNRAGTSVQNIALLFSGRDLDLGWLFGALDLEPLLVAPTDFGGELRAGGADTAEMLAGLTGAVHVVSGHGALRGAVARGLALSGVKLPRLDGAPALPLECLAGRIEFSNGIGNLGGFSMRGAGYTVTAEGHANLGRQRIDMRFYPIAEANQTQPELLEGVAYKISGPINKPEVGRAGTVPESSGAPLPPVASRDLPSLRGEVARNNPCLADIRAARAAEGEGQ